MSDQKRNIYFAGSIRGGRQDVGFYHKIITELKTNFGNVLTEFVGDENYGKSSDIIERLKDPKKVHEDDMASLRRSQFLVAEVTQPSLGVGYEIGRAVDMKIPILCLYRPQEGKALSCMISGAQDGKTFFVSDYSDVAQVPDILKEFFAKFKQ